jgi:hypothetical protein
LVEASPAAIDRGVAGDRNQPERAPPFAVLGKTNFGLAKDPALVAHEA